MSKRQSHDIGHSEFTDHRIKRLPIRSEATLGPRSLRPWRPHDGPVARRNLGIALIRRAQSESPAGDIKEGEALLQSALSAQDRDPVAQEALGTGLLLSGVPSKGLRLLQKAVRADPDRSRYRNSLEAAWWNLCAERAPVREIERSIRLEPHLESAYHMPSRVNLALGMRNRARPAWALLLEQRPRPLVARERLALLSESQSQGGLARCGPRSSKCGFATRTSPCRDAPKHSSTMDEGVAKCSLQRCQCFRDASDVQQQQQRARMAGRGRALRDVTERAPTPETPSRTFAGGSVGMRPSRARGSIGADRPEVLRCADVEASAGYRH